MRWGPTDEEVNRPLLGDDMVSAPDVRRYPRHFDRRTTRARRPWLVQVGTRRAGWYIYDLLDNLGQRSAWRIIPELQGLPQGTWPACSYQPVGG